MNAHSYKTVFSKRLGTLVAVGEHASSQGKANGAGSGGGAGAAGASATLGYIAALTASFAFVSLAWAAPANNALPTSGTVVQGAASMAQSASQLNITQSTQRAAINWQSFDIGSQARVQIYQPNAQSVLLNRVVGATPSQIFGQMQANGHVILVNPNGVLFGKDGSVNAGGFTASTLNISDANFMAGNMVYERNGSTAGIVNEGNITTAPGGYVALLGATVSNEGSIKTQGGSVVMGAGETIKVPVSGTGRIKLELTPAAINASVSNSGSIVTDGGQVYMQALALNRAAAQILQSGSIDTTGEKGGDVHVLADGGHIRVDGRIKANSTDGTAGGTIMIGRRDETKTVDGETVTQTILAAVSDVSGAQLESRGGFVETSGDWLATKGVTVLAKDWLLDPTDIKIVANDTPTPPTASSNVGGITGTTTFQDSTTTGASEVLKADIESAINGGTNVTISTTNGPGTGQGNITIETALTFNNIGSQDATLKLEAKNGIIQNSNASITETGTDPNRKLVHVVMTAEGLPGGVPIAAGATNVNSKGITINGNITTNGKITLTGTSYAPSGGSGLGVNSNGTLTAGGDVLVTGTAKGGSTGANVRNIISNGGTVTVIGTSATGAGATTTTGSISAAGDVTVTGTSSGAATGANTGSITSTNGSVEVTGTSVSGSGTTTSAINAKNNVNVKGTSNSGAGVGSIGAIGTTSTPIGGTVTVEGYSSATSVASTNINAAITATGDVVIKGIGAAKHGVFLNGNVTSKAGGIEVTGDTLTAGYTTHGASASGLGVGGSGTLTAEKNIKVTGNTTSDAAVKAFAAYTSNNGNVEITGTSGQSNGVNLTSMITAKNGKVDLTGTSGGPTAGVNINAAAAGIEAGSYSVQGTSANSAGVNINGTWTNKATFTSTSTTFDSFIEGKTTSGGAGVVVGDGTLTINSAATAASTKGKVFVRNTFDSKAGVNLYQKAKINTNNGDVTFGRNDTDTSALWMQAVTATADGGKLSFLGKSSSKYGIAFQTMDVGLVSITGINGAAIVLDGTSTATDGSQGINTRWVAAANHKITSSGTDGSVTIKGTSATGTGAHIDLTTVTSNNGNAIDITGKGGSAGKGVYMSRLITANGGGNINITGTASGSGNAVELSGNSGAGVITADTGKVTITGNAPGTVGTGAGISSTGNISGGTVEMLGYTAGNNAGISTSGLITATSATPGTGSGVVKTGDVKLEGTSAGGLGVVMSSNSATPAISATNEVNIKGTSTASADSKHGILLNGTTTVQGQTVTVTGESVNGNAVIAYAAINATTGNVKITGTSTGASSANTASALSLQGVITADLNIQIVGANTNASNTTNVAYLNKAVTATKGKIDVTASTNGTTANALTLASGAKLTGATEVNVKADTLSIDTSTNTAINASTVTIKTDSTDAKINIGAGDAGKTSLTSATLGLTNVELNRITAGNLVVGDASNTGGITVSAATTTNADTGNVTLQTGGNIAISAPLTVGTITDRKNLELKAGGGQITQAANATITANQLSIQAAQASVALAAAANQVNQLAANVNSLEFKNGKALQIGVGATGITASGRIKVETTTGNLNLNQAVTSSAQNVTDAVTLIADANKNAGDSDGGNIIKGIDGLVSVGDGSTAKLYTGSIDGSTGMQALTGGAGSGRYRYNSDESVSGTNFSKALEAGVNVIYREAPEVTVKVNDVNKVYDGVAHSGGSFSSASTAGGLKNGDTDAVVGSNAVFSGNAQGVKDVLASVGKTISASDNGKNALGYEVIYTEGNLSIAPRPLTIAPGSVATKTADGTTTAAVTPGALSNLVGTETLGVAATGTFSDANAGNNKAVNAFYTLQNGANGGVASNYILALGKPGNPDTRMTGNILASVNPVINPTPTPVNNNTGSRVSTVSGFGGSGAATGVLDDKPVTESREVCSDVFPENCECQPSVIPSIEICFAPKSVAATKEEK